MDASDLYRRVSDLLARKRRALAQQVGYAHLPPPSYRLVIASERQAAYARAAMRFAEHCRRVRAVITTNTERKAA